MRERYLCSLFSLPKRDEVDHMSPGGAPSLSAFFTFLALWRHSPFWREYDGGSARVPRRGRASERHAPGACTWCLYASSYHLRSLCLRLPQAMIELSPAVSVRDSFRFPQFTPSDSFAGGAAVWDPACCPPADQLVCGVCGDQLALLLQVLRLQHACIGHIKRGAPALLTKTRGPAPAKRRSDRWHGADIGPRVMHLESDAVPRAQINTDTSRLCRSLHVLACLRNACQGQTDSWRCFRC